MQFSHRDRRALDNLSRACTWSAYKGLKDIQPSDQRCGVSGRRAANRGCGNVYLHSITDNLREYSLVLVWVHPWFNHDLRNGFVEGTFPAH